MAIIVLDQTQLKNINNELNSLDTTLLKDYFPELEDLISQIKNNVQNSEIHSILNTISGQISTISGDIGYQLPKLERFLEEQLSSYTTTEEEAESRVNKVVQTMATFAGYDNTTSGKNLKDIVRGIGESVGNTIREVIPEDKIVRGNEGANIDVYKSEGEGPIFTNFGHDVVGL